MYREVTAFVDDYLVHRDSNSETSKHTYQMLDCTFGGGNHSVPLLKKHTSLRVLGVDLDTKVMNACREQYSEMIASKRLALEHSNYVHSQHIDVKAAFKKRIGVTQKHDIALLDLGFSSYQLEDRERGFSYIGPDD